MDRIAALDTTAGAPHVLLARTTFGKGVSYMESKIAWHYWPMNDDQYAQAIRELEGAGSVRSAFVSTLVELAAAR